METPCYTWSEFLFLADIVGARLPETGRDKPGQAWNGRPRKKQIGDSPEQTVHIEINERAADSEAGDLSNLDLPVNTSQPVERVFQA